jgi:hypothetical protein
VTVIAGPLNISVPIRRSRTVMCPSPVDHPHCTSSTGQRPANSH